MKRQLILINVLVLTFFIFDRILKGLALNGYIWDFGVFQFSLTINKNIALGIPLKGLFFYFLLIVVLLLIIKILIISYQRKEKKEIVFWTLILIGASSNVLDRLKYGSVIDYFHFFHLTVLNLADVLIFVGAAALLIRIFYRSVLVKKR